MTRTIKFRAWNPDSKKMTFVPNVQGSYLHLGYSNEFISNPRWFVSDGKESVAYSDRSVLMQFTGLCDKNGNPVYEGDIVKTWKYDEHGLAKDIFTKVEYNEYMILPNPLYDSPEVVGDIYSSPELLN